MWFCFQWRVMQEKIWNGHSYKQKPCYFRKNFCINSLEERHWFTLELGMETQTNQAREKKPKVFEKGFSKAVIAKLEVPLGFFGNCQTLHIAFPTTQGHCSSLGKQHVGSTSLGRLWNVRGRRIKREGKIRKISESSWTLSLCPFCKHKLRTSYSQFILIFNRFLIFPSNISYNFKNPEVKRDRNIKSEKLDKRNYIFIVSLSGGKEKVHVIYLIPLAKTFPERDCLGASWYLLHNMKQGSKETLAGLFLWSSAANPHLSGRHRDLSKPSGYQRGTGHLQPNARLAEWRKAAVVPQTAPGPVGLVI